MGKNKLKARLVGEKKYSRVGIETEQQIIGGTKGERQT
jgi:hypothetical protein